MTRFCAHQNFKVCNPFPSRVMNNSNPRQNLPKTTCTQENIIQVNSYPRQLATKAAHTLLFGKSENKGRVGPLINKHTSKPNLATREHFYLTQYIHPE